MSKRNLRLGRNNVVELVGEVISQPVFDHSVYEKQFFKMILSVERLSGYKDIIPVMIPGSKINPNLNYVGKRMYISGGYRSYNDECADGHHLRLYVFANELFEVSTYDRDYKTSLNSAYFEGFICREPIFRTTPLGKKISNVFIAVNRVNGRSDYIPCIFWEENAKDVSQLKVGQKIEVVGRIQSRDYQKRMAGGSPAKRRAWEVSVAAFRKIDR